VHRGGGVELAARSTERDHRVVALELTERGATRQPTKSSHEAAMENRKSEGLFLMGDKVNGNLLRFCEPQDR